VTSSYLKTDRHFAQGGPLVKNGRTAPNTDAGLGITPELDMLGEPLFEITG